MAENILAGAIASAGLGLNEAQKQPERLLDELTKLANLQRERLLAVLGSLETVCDRLGLQSLPVPAPASVPEQLDAIVNDGPLYALQVQLHMIEGMTDRLAALLNQLERL